MPQTSGRNRFALFDGLRAIAALTVFLSHVGVATEEHRGVYAPLGHGFMFTALNDLDWGVAIFFLISGFLLYRPFVTARLAGQPFGTRAFYRRRVMRVIPAYWLALTVLAVYPGLGLTTGNWWLFYGLTHIYTRSTSYAGLTVSWTLCVEASFYLLLPWYSRLAARWSIRREIRVLAFLGVAAMVLQVGVTDTGHDASLFFLTRTLPLCLDWFALGMGLALASAVGLERLRHEIPMLRRLPLNGSAWWWVASVAIWLGCVEWETVREWQPMRHLLYGLAAFCLLVPAVFEGEGLVKRVLSSRLLVWLGVVSYGVYLWQLRILLWLHDHGMGGRSALGMLELAATGLILTLALAAGSYYLVERPILRRRYRTAHTPVAADNQAPAVIPQVGA